MKQYEHLQVDRDARGVVKVAFDLRNRPVNVFEEQFFLELTDVIEELERDRTVRLVVFRSAKESGFLAGADVHQIRKLVDAEQAQAVLQAGQDLFQRVENLAVPTMAVIHGNCLGGGLEFALACSYRIARNDSSTRLGLPETQLGLLPAWGGTQRLPRQVGLQTALQMILTGTPLSADKAKRSGLVDEVAAPESFEADVAAFADRLLAGRRPAPASRGWFAGLRDRTALGRALVLKLARRGIARHARHYPALPAVLRTIDTGCREGMTSGLAREREEFARLVFTPTSRNLVELFLQRERARASRTWVSSDDDGRAIKTLAVLGAGTMGAGIAQLAATKGYRVILKDLDESAVQRGMQQIEALTRKGVEKGALQSSDAEAAIAAVTATTEQGPLQRADLVIEAVVERLDVKQQVFRELDARLPGETVFVSNTSALPISALSAVTQRGDRVAGLHFFNPVHKMPLVEVVRLPETSDATIAALVEVVRALGKTPIVVAEGPGFLVNRILFPYLDEAVRLVVEGQSIAEVDREAKRFGMPMGPLELIDTVGIDIAADVSRNLAAIGFGDSPTPQFLSEMAAQGRLGQKAGQGFYRYRRGRRRRPLLPTAAAHEPAKLPSPQDFQGERISGVQQRLVFSLINAAAGVLHNRIVPEPWMVDLGMVLGTGFAPFRGGPLRLAESWGHDKVVETLEALARLCGPRFRPSPYFTDPCRIANSQTSHRPMNV
ncbi:MAG: 3-hydroxyacyl-CoA dehydrogenase NAD-binding domain-containing protein [Planctomycetaceae bacterium]